MQELTYGQPYTFFVSTDYPQQDVSVLFDYFITHTVNHFYLLQFVVQYLQHVHQAENHGFLIR